ncbi:hypothetical protein F5Y18DRAFT_423590 [Xylariaceae sp. FL1019]|nr:hypothetical protein F5Y18DRAFT_423590 [Xylariaceae sp. FL1019]
MACVGTTVPMHTPMGTVDMPLHPISTATAFQHSNDPPKFPDTVSEDENIVESEDEESDNVNDTPTADVPSQDVAIFREWLRNQRAAVHEKMRASEMAGGSSPDEENDRTTRDAPIITSPREYQTELFERAKKKNIIAVLDTGTGKTLIAALLLRYYVEQELEDRHAGKPHKLAFFLVDKVALVHQQYRVLSANLDFDMDSFSGDSNSPKYTQTFWDEARDNKTVVVCTAAILAHCLQHAFIRMEQISLLIFDEAHHAKKNHHYARIVKDFYAPLEKSFQPPRILGLTASPVDAKTEVSHAAAHLEGLLHCEIATVADPGSFMRACINKAVEHQLEYPRACEPFRTPLWQTLHKLIGDNRDFDKLFTYSNECTAVLGRWCADRWWQMYLTKDVANTMAARVGRQFSKILLQESIAILDARQRAVQKAYKVVEQHQFADVVNDCFHLSGKVRTLIAYLQEQFEPKRDKCVIFADQRRTVTLLADLLNQPNLCLRDFRAGTLIGSSGGACGDIGMSLAEQKTNINRFRHGEINCLVATSAGEEGIDIPDCNIVVRFDLSKTAIQHIQSRGRARRPDSKLYHMIEIGNTEHQESITQLQDSEYKLREFCSTLPEDRLVLGSDYNMDYHLSREKHLRKYRVPSTGATLTYQGSLTILANFVSTLPRPLDAPCPTADYIIFNPGDGFRCDVVLPDASPVKHALGCIASTKQVAKCAAAFEMCLLLIKGKHLDENLRSTFVKRLPAMRNAQLAISSKKRDIYTMKMKPTAWSSTDGSDSFFITILKLSDPDMLGRQSVPIALVTRVPLPRVANFPVFFGSQRGSNVECLPLPGDIMLTPDLVVSLNHFTLRIFKDVFSKEYAFEPAKMSYFFAPLMQIHDWRWSSETSHLNLIDWACVTRVQSSAEEESYENHALQNFCNRFVIDPHDGSRKFFTAQARPDLRPTNLQLPGVSTSRQIKKAQQQGTVVDIWNFSVSLWSKARTRISRDDNLTVFEAEYVPHRRNLLDKSDDEEANQRKCFIVFQTLKLSALPPDLAAMAFILPAIIHRLESNLIVLEFCESIGLELRPDLALEAMTKDSDNTEDHSGQPINLQKGMGKNYERLEFLGDCFLKMSTTIAIFSQRPDRDEFEYHVDRMILICNKNLFNTALDLKVQESIRSKAFSRRTWYPEGLELLKGKQNTSRLGKKDAGSDGHSLGDKSIADVCEALIGAAYMTTYNQKSFDMAIQAVTKFVNHRDHKVTSWGDYYSLYHIPEWQKRESTEPHRVLVGRIEKELGYRFNYPRLLRSAFTHPSYGFLYEGIPHYQRLEFLGDALIDMVCVDYLFHRFPEADPQWLTEHKMAMVSNHFLGYLCASLDLHRHLLAMNPEVQRSIAEYVTSVTQARILAEDAAEKVGLGRNEYQRNFWVSERRPPKCLPDIVESYIGALFVDSGYDFSQVQKFFDMHILPYFRDMHLYDTFANDHPIIHLRDVMNDFHCRRWRVLCSDTDDELAGFSATKVVAVIMIHGVVRASRFADSGRYAKPKVARSFLSDVQGMTMNEYKGTYNCTCPAKSEDAGTIEDHATAA